MENKEKVQEKGHIYRKGLSDLICTEWIDSSPSFEKIQYQYLININITTAYFFLFHVAQLQRKQSQQMIPNELTLNTEAIKVRSKETSVFIEPWVL